MTLPVDVALGDRLLEQRQPLRDREHRLLAGVVHDEHVQLVVQRRGATDDVEMTQGRRVEGSGDDGDPAAHAASLSAAAIRAPASSSSRSAAALLHADAALDARRRGPGCRVRAPGPRRARCSAATARCGDEIGILDDAQQPQRRSRAGLRVAEHVALAAQLEVDLGEREAVERAPRRRRPARAPACPAGASVTSRQRPGTPPRPTRPRS